MSLALASQRVSGRVGGGRTITSLVDVLSTYLQGNAVASGGLTVLVAGSALALTQKAATSASALLLRRFVARADFDSRDDSYRWMVSWLASQRVVGEARAYTVTTTLRRLGATGDDGGDEGVYLLPSGSSLLRFGRKWALLRRERSDDDAKSSKERESLTLWVLGGSKDDLRAVVDAARAHYASTRRRTTSVYALEDYGSWALVATRAARPLASVVLNDPDAAAALRDDCATFLASEALYARRGIPYRRGYLLHGAPGTGKTSAALAIAAELERTHGLRGLYVVSPALDELNDATFAEALRNAKSPSILLIEDIDAAFSAREGRNANGLTFSGLLNALDGALAQEGRLLFLTTNHPERLDPALVRPGRVDYKLEFGHATDDAARRYAAHFYADAATPADVAAIAAAAAGQRLSVAQLQAAFSRHPDDPRAAAAAVRALEGGS